MSSFSIDKLALKIEQEIPKIEFAYLFGSSQKGRIKPSSDIDIGIFLDGPVTEYLIIQLSKIVEEIANSKCDLTILNTASEILSFEILQGKLLFIREDKIENYTGFYSLTCRKYEDKIAWMKKQLSLRGYA